jgi:ferredoxin-NADP reductase/MOSC domain-containing protein YiiM/ferredoxin
MTNRQPDANSRLRRARRWRPDPYRLAAAAAANGDPTALLALDALELHDLPGQHADGPVVGRLLSVNVGRPRNVAWEGKTVRTAIWKDRVDGPRMVRKINIDGDDQADRKAHGGEHRAVFVYQIESYAYWRQHLGRHDFTYGQFGENFTVEGMADDEVCIGDRFQIGEATFEVTQPRVTCFRVGIRMRDPAMPSLLVSHHRPGFYLRVLQEGEVEAGQPILKLSDGPEQMSVAEIDALLYLPKRSRRNLARATQIPALSEGWQSSFRSLLEQLDSPPGAGGAAEGGAWAGFVPLPVKAIRRESEEITSFEFAADGVSPVAVARPGQFLTLRLWPNGGQNEPILRSYSMSSPASEDGYRISVKRERGGIGSTYLHDEVAVGDTIEVAAPRGNFVLDDEERPVVFASAGVGATPVLAMLHQLAEERSLRSVWWLHGAHDGGHHAFREEVDELLGSLADSHRLVCYSQPGAGDGPRGSAYDVAGRLVPTLLGEERVPIDAVYYLCGPPAFLRDFGAGLAARGVPAQQVHAEIFGSQEPLNPGIVQTGPHRPHKPKGRAGTGPLVSFVRSNLAVRWDPDYENLLELAEDCEVPVRFSCRTGVCHYCETGCLNGSVDYDPNPLEVPAPGKVLLCCSSPHSDLALDL